MVLTKVEDPQKATSKLSSSVSMKRKASFWGFWNKFRIPSCHLVSHTPQRNPDRENGAVNTGSGIRCGLWRGFGRGRRMSCDLHRIILRLLLLRLILI
jgi:hypothetical protein